MGGVSSTCMDLRPYRFLVVGQSLVPWHPSCLVLVCGFLYANSPFCYVKINMFFNLFFIFLTTTNVVSNALSSFQLAGSSTLSTPHQITVILEFI